MARTERMDAGSLGHDLLQFLEGLWPVELLSPIGVVTSPVPFRGRRLGHCIPPYRVFVEVPMSMPSGTSAMSVLLLCLASCSPPRASGAIPGQSWWCRSRRRRNARWRDGDECIRDAAEGGHDRVRLRKLFDGGRRRGLAAQQPDGVQPGLLCRSDVVVDAVADVHGSVGLDTGLLQGPLPHARTGCLGEVDLLWVDNHVEVLHEPVAFQRRDVLLARIGDYAELVPGGKCSQRGPGVRVYRRGRNLELAFGELVQLFRIAAGKEAGGDGPAQ